MKKAEIEKKRRRWAEKAIKKRARDKAIIQQYKHITNSETGVASKVVCKTSLPSTPALLKRSPEVDVRMNPSRTAKRASTVVMAPPPVHVQQQFFDKLLKSMSSHANPKYRFTKVGSNMPEGGELFDWFLAHCQVREMVVNVDGKMFLQMAAFQRL